MEAGTGPLADAVRALGLTRAPDTCNWGERLRMSIHRAQPLDPAPPGATAPAEAPPTTRSYRPWP
jgi:hypothetical protein